MDPTVLLGTKAGMIFAFVYLLQVVKKQLKARGITVFKNEDSWLWVVVIAGVPLAFVQQLIQGLSNFNVGGFIELCLFFMAGAAFIYKVYKVTKNGLEKRNVISPPSSGDTDDTSDDSESPPAGNG